MAEGLLSGLHRINSDALLYEQMACGFVALTGCTMEQARKLIGALIPHIVIPENPDTLH